MKATAILIALFPIVCYAQKNNSVTATEKPATDACPTFKKGKQPSKADYFRSLRTVKRTTPTTPGNTELAYNTPKPVTTRRQPVEKPVTRTEKPKPYVPSFTGTEVAAEPKKVPAEKPVVASDEKVKPEAPESTKTPEPKTPTKTINTESKEKIKTRVKQQPAKKSTKAPGVKRIKTKRGNNEKCPAF